MSALHRPAPLAYLRLARVALHLAAGLATVACLYPFVSRRMRLGLKRRWSAQLLAILGLRLVVAGTPVAGMRVANHISWLDVFALNAVAPSAFVAKAEVRGWPLIGWLCARTETLFIRRGSHRAAHGAAHAAADLLRAGMDIAAFPEGTTSEGERVLPFHAAVLQGAIEAGRPVQAVAIAYGDAGGQRSSAAAYCGDTGLLESLRRIVATRGLVVRVECLPPRRVVHWQRRELAAALRADIVLALAQAGDFSSKASVGTGKRPGMASLPALAGSSAG